jgi:hypothetical protein
VISGKHLSKKGSIGSPKSFKGFKKSSTIGKIDLFAQKASNIGFLVGDDHSTVGEEPSPLKKLTPFHRKSNTISTYAAEECQEDRKTSTS